MSEHPSSSASSDFSDGCPTTTTISTVAVQAGNARIVLAVLRCGNWIRVRIQRMEPDLYDIGGNAEEARALHQVHNHLCEKLAAKQDQISQLLSRADDLVTQQTSESQTQVYAAMAESLNRAWRDLLGVLTQRGHLLELAVECFTAAEHVVSEANRVEHLCNTGGWGHDVESVKRLIEEHEVLKRTSLLEPSHRMLNAANNLLELLARLSNQTAPSAPLSPSAGGSRASVEARERVASITAKGGAARRHAESVWNRRDRLLHLRLAIVSMESELDRIVDWFIKVGEPRLYEAQIGQSLSECQSQLDSLMSLAEEVRDMQSVHTRLMRNLQQTSSADQWRGIRPKTIFETLEAAQQELETELSRSYSYYGPMEIDDLPEDSRVANEETWRETHGAYSQLANRMRTTEAYIWEFLDRLEHKRKLLHTGVIYYSEANVMLTQIYELESEMKHKQDQPAAGLEDSYFDRLNSLEVRVPGLRQILAELRSGHEEDIYPKSTFRSQLGVTVTRPPIPDYEITSKSVAAAIDKMKEVEDGIARCRSLFSTYQERSIKAQRRQEVETRIEMLMSWLNQRIERSLVEHANMGTTCEQVADFEDFHRRLERELDTRESELDEVRATIGRLSPSSAKSSLELHLSDLNSRWTRCRHTIRQRTQVADQFLSLLRRIREDDHQQTLVLERMQQMDGTDTSLLTSDAVDGMIGIEGPDRLRSEVTMIISRLEEQQSQLRGFVDQITQRCDRDLNTAEPVRYCQLQIQMNAKHLDQLRECWINCERFWEQWKMAREYWIMFNNGARDLDEMMATSLSRMSRTPMPTKPFECEQAMREHQLDRDQIDQMSNTVRSQAQQLGQLVGARPDDRVMEGHGWTFVEVPLGPEAGLPASGLGRRVRSELTMQLAGLATRWSAWDRAWTTRRIQLERHGLQVGRLATIEEVEGELVAAETDLQTISNTISLTAPLEQIERAERDLSRLESTIPVLKNRVRSTAPDMRMQLLQGEPAPTEIGELPIDVTQRHEALSTRFDHLVDATSRCRVEVNLTLRLLRAIRVAENALSQITFSLTGATDQVKHLPQEDSQYIYRVRNELEEHLIRSQAMADTHIPTLEQLAAQHPSPTEAQKKIEPVVSGFRDTVGKLHRLTEEVRIRSEQSIYLARPVGVPVPSDLTSQQVISPPIRGRPPVITRPLNNLFTEEGSPVTLETEFDSGLPPDVDPFDRTQLQTVWLKDGYSVVTPDYESQIAPNKAVLRIGETLSEDTARFTCRVITPYGQAETSCNLVVHEAVSPVAKPVDESIIQPTRRPRARQPLIPRGEPPRFIRDLPSKTVRESEEFDIECQAVGQPTPTLSWFRNGECIDDHPDYQITVTGGSGHLKVRQSRMTLHEGTYSCKATNPIGEARTTCRVTIQPGSPPVIVRPLHDVQLNSGDRAKLSVQYKSSLPVNIEWFHAGIPIRGEFGRRRITMVGADVVSLNFPQISPLEEGEYTCIVRNAIGEASTACHVRVTPEERSPKESPIPLDELIDAYRAKPPRERPAAQRRRLDLSADFDEVFEPAKAPRLTDESRVPAERTVIRRDRVPSYPEQSHVVDFRRATSVPIHEVTTYPSVLLRTPIAVQRPTSLVGHPPQFVQPLHNAGASEGQKIKLECKVTGQPHPQIQWLKNGAPLPRSNAYEIREEGPINSLIFYDLFLEDQGEYTCVARNPLGQVQTSCRMDVEPVLTGEKPMDEAPQVVRPLPSQMVVEEGHEVRMECVFSGRPTPTVVWLKDGVQPVSSPEFQPTQQGGVAGLYIPQMRADRAGIYEAVATNPVGTCRTTLFLQLVPLSYSSMPSPTTRPRTPIAMGTGPEFTRIFKDIYIESERLEEVVLECTVTGVPRPSVYWTHNGRLITGDDPRFTPVQGPGPDDHCLIIRHPDAWATGRYQAVAENIQGRATCSAVVNPVSYSPTISSRPPSVWSLSRLSRQQYHMRTREMSMPPSPATTVPLVSPRALCTVQVPVTPIRFRRETSAPPMQHYMTSHHLRVVPRQTTPPVQFTVSLPRKERSLSRTEIHRNLESRLPLKPEIRHYSSSQYLNRMHVTPMVPQINSSITRRVASQPRLEPGYSSEDEHEHAMSVVPMVKHYKTRMERSLAARPRLRPGFRSEVEYRHPISVTPMVPEYRSSMERTLRSAPHLEAAYASEAEKSVAMEVVPMVPEYKTQLTREVPSRPTVRHGYAVERQHMRSMEITPMRPEYQTKMEHQVVGRPELETGYASEGEYERPMEVVPVVPHTEYKTELETEVKARPQLMPGFTAETKHPREMEVTPMTTEYRTQMDRQVVSRPILEAGYSSEEEHATKMEVVPIVQETSYRTEISTDVHARPKLTPGYISETDFKRTIEVTPMIQEYRTELDTRVASHPRLEAGFASEGEREMTMEVVPVVPEFRTELTTGVAERPTVIYGQESRYEMERSIQWETELKQYQSALSTTLPSRPSLTSIYSSTLERETRMNVVPVVPQEEEHHVTHLTRDFVVEYRPVDVVVEVPIPPQFVQPLSSVMAAEGTRVVLDGVVTGHPQPVISWFRQGRKLEDGPDVRLEFRDNQVRLTLSEAFAEDTGEYTCEAENVAGRAQSTATIVIQARLMAPHFIKGLESQVIHEGQSVRLVVKVDGHPPPTVTWICNGREIVSSPHYTLEVKGDGVHVLNIPEAYFADTGRYTVIAKNPAGESVTSGLLTMQEPEHRHPTPVKEVHHHELTLQMESLKQTPLPSPPPPQPQPERPQFSQTFLPQMELVEGDRLVLTVEAWGNPLPFIQWFRNGQPIHEAPDCQITQVGPPLDQPEQLQPRPVRMTGQLIINETFLDDAGRYTCVAVNSVGQAETGGSVRIVPKPTIPEPKPVTVEERLQPPELVRSPPFSLDNELDQPLILEADAIGNPTPELRIYHNGKLVTSDTRHSLEALPGTGSLSMCVTKFGPQDEGDWTIVASNSVGTTSKTVIVTARQPVPTEPEKPEFQEMEVRFTKPPTMIPPKFLDQIPERVEVEENKPIVLRSRVVGQPKPTLECLLHGKPLQQTDVVRCVFEGPESVILYLAHPKPEQSGMYTMTIENPAGKDSVTFEVVITPAEKPPIVTPSLTAPPRFLRGPLPWPASETGELITCPGQLALKEDQPSSLEVEVIGQPAPAVAWFRNSQAIPTDGTHKMYQRLEGNFTLLLDRPKPEEDSGAYMCVATNSVGQAVLQFTVQIQPKPVPSQPPKFVQKPPVELVGEMYKPLTMHATVEGTPKPVLSWHKDGTLVSSTNDGRIMVDMRDYETTIYIASFQPEDRGQWQCLAANIAGTATARTVVYSAPQTVTVVKPVEVVPLKKQPTMRPPRFIQFLQPVTATEASEVSFFVEFDGEPVPEVKWLRDDAPLEARPDVEILITGTTSQLIIPEVFPEDAGTYSVVLQNPAGQACSKSRLIVEAPPEAKPYGKPPKFEQPLIHPVTVKAGEPVTFECKVHGEPVPQVHWERNGVRLPVTDTTHRRMFDAPPFHTLVICEAVPEDTAEYSCVAVNPLGQDVTKTTVRVEAPVKPTTLIAPQIVQAPRNMTVLESQPVTFTARLKGVPMPEVTWLCRGEVIKPSSYFQPQLLPTGEARLLIMNAYMEDAGEYTIRAENPAGEVTASAQLTVQQPQPKETLPRFTKPLPSGPIHVEEGSPIQLTVEFEGEPQPQITWCRDGVTHASSPDWTITTLNQTSTLECREVFYNDSATWTVHAINKVGQATTQTEITIVPLQPASEVPKPIQAPPVFQRRLPAHMKTKLHHTVTLTCVVTGQPQPLVRWFHNGVEFFPQQIPQPHTVPSAKHEILIDQATHTYTLYVHDLNAFDVGEIMVRAENEFGVTMCHSSLELEVLDGQVVEPRFVIQPPDRVQVQPGQTARLECEVEAQPPVTFRWYLNGLQVDQTMKQYRVVEEVNRTTLIIPKIESASLPTQVKVEAAAPTGTKIVSTSVMEMMASTDTTDISFSKAPLETRIQEPLQFKRQLPANITFGDQTETLQFDVEVNEIPSEKTQPVFSWHLNGVELFPQSLQGQPERFHVTQRHPTHSNLIIDRPSHMDSGELTCTITRTSDIGEEKIRSTCSLDFKYPEVPKPEEKVITEVSITPQFEQSLPATVSPTFGSDVVLLVTVKGSPTPNVNWGVSSPETAQRCEIIPGEQVDKYSTQYKMILHDFQQSDRNTVIEAVASSELGQVTSVCQLMAPVEVVVQPRPEEKINIEFTKALSPMKEVQLDETVIMECAIRPVPVPVEFHWDVSGTEVTTQMPMFDVQTTQYSTTMRIEHMRPEYAGMVSVVAAYPQGQTTSKGELRIAPVQTAIVQTKPETTAVAEEVKLEFSEPLKVDILPETEETQKLVMECHVLSEEREPIRVHWLHEEQELVPSERMEMVYLEDTGISRLTVHQIQSSDSGQYTCVATVIRVDEKTEQATTRTIKTTADVIIRAPIEEAPVPVTQAVEQAQPVEETKLAFTKPVTPSMQTAAEQKILE
ncbi:Titin [Fasciola hepatica]|uniref:Titin n=1 Tax=Fasciola hepatica TaxID=6192 RepID=A0A4E0S1I1_FASHE|nr:Titin [Fasciola hepatica]